MTTNHEQIQALKAAADYQEKHSRLWERFDEAAHDNAEHMRNILQSALDALEGAERLILKTQKQVIPLLAEREADKALIAELTQQLQQEQDYALSSDLDRMEMHKTLEARTLTVKLPPVSFFDFKAGSGFASGAYVNVEAMNKELIASGITLVVEEE